MGRSLLKHSTLQLAKDHESEENDDQEDDRDSDADQDCRVIWISADCLRPGGLTELVSTCVSTYLRKEKNIISNVTLAILVNT